MNEELRSFRIGAVRDYAELPAEVNVDGVPYWLVREERGEGGDSRANAEDAENGGGYALLMAVCPHAGGDIRRLEGMLFCPLHFWTFDEATGHCLNQPDERLLRRSVREENGILFAFGDPR